MGIVKITSDGTYLCMSYKETHTGTKPYFYTTSDVNCADIFKSEKLVNERAFDAADLDLFYSSISVETISERYVRPVQKKKRRKIMIFWIVLILAILILVGVILFHSNGRI